MSTSMPVNKIRIDHFLLTKKLLKRILISLWWINTSLVFDGFIHPSGTLARWSTALWQPSSLSWIFQSACLLDDANFIGDMDGMARVFHNSAVPLMVIVPKVREEVSLWPWWAPSILSIVMPREFVFFPLWNGKSFVLFFFKENCW